MELFGIQFGPVLPSLIVTVVGGLVLRALQPKVNVIWAEPHAFVFLARGPDPNAPQINVHTRTIFVQNVGKSPAEDVEVIFNWKPDTYNLWPVLPHETEVLPDDRFVLRAHNLGMKEWFRVELLSIDPLPDTVRVRSRDGEAKLVPMQPIRVFPRWLILTIWAFVAVGAFAIIYHATAWLMSIS